MTAETVREVLVDLGYTLSDNGREFRARPIYRESGNTMSLCVYKHDGRWTDFGVSKSGRLEDLVKITLNLKDISQAKEYLENSFSVSTLSKRDKPLLHNKNVTFDKEVLLDMIPNHEYWVNRGISTETMLKFKGGVMTKGKLANRYVFPIFDSRENLIGLTGRDLTGRALSKWKHQGLKSTWKYPLFLNWPVIKESKTVILVESLGCLLSLYDNDVKNVMVCFGTKLSSSMIECLLKMDPKKIIVSLNNEPDNNSIGNNASEEFQRSLLNYFDKNQIKICLPPTKDWGEASKEQIRQFKNSHNENSRS